MVRATPDDYGNPSGAKFPGPSWRHRGEFLVFGRRRRTSQAPGKADVSGDHSPRMSMGISRSQVYHGWNSFASCFHECLKSNDPTTPRFINGRSSGSNRWRYVNVPYVWPYVAGIFPEIEVKNGPKIDGIGTSNQSVPESWPLRMEQIQTSSDYIWVCLKM